MVRIIFICTGNICRSPMAEGLFRFHWRLKKNRDDGSVFSSMGIRGLDDHPPSDQATALCREYGIDISAHRSRPLVFEELYQADLIFTMERVQTEYLRLFFPQIRDRTAVLGAWPDASKRKADIADPFRKSERHYRKAFETINAHVQRIIPCVEATFGA